MERLSGRVAVVTGAGSGIGRALAERFAAEGMGVAIADIEEEPLEDVRRDLAGRGAPVVAQVLDVGDERAVHTFADRVFDHFGAVHLLCNNAGVFSGGQIWSRPARDFAWTLQVNLWGVLHGIQAFVPRMIEGGDEGHVVNTASVAGLFASPFSGPYSISKFAAYAATECLAHELVITGSKLRASALCPGGVATRIHQSDRNRPATTPTAPSDDQAFVDQVIADTVAGGIPPEQVADQVVDAVRTQRFLILTHDTYRPGLTARATALTADALPDLPTYEPHN
ncbi:SDR family NAD(P)-dependent oxidoreductase [Actinomadura oligospora]|uniref:SDR family NAD(P)-dependent oxidoreductase n=1 Tax=Actinomadura oligospora TaxID=111804 RepID=UPI0004BAFE2C|nr:SDR family NAD(P)-dependent oxidoreductase [Actinomadura oligospora]